VVRFLVERLGFTGLALEMPALVGERLDAYVNGGGGELQVILAQSAPFNGPEMVAMFEWIKSYNADPSHSTKVRLTGIDVPWVAPAVFDDVVRLVATQTPAVRDSVRRAYAPVRKASLDTSYTAGGASAQYMALSPAIKGDLRARAEAVEQILAGLPSSPGVDSALVGARLISQVARLWHLLDTDPAAGVRDHERSMAANVVQFKHRVGKAAAWAHDGHVARWTMIPKVYPDSMMGTYLGAELAASYLSVGTTFGRGAYNALVRNNAGTVSRDSLQSVVSSEIVAIRVERPAPGSVNVVLDDVEGLGYLLDLRTAPANVRAWLEQPRPFQMGFASAVNDSAWLAENTLPSGNLLSWFDVVIHLREVSAGRSK
jgi:erythromycin esterase